MTESSDTRPAPPAELAHWRDGVGGRSQDSDIGPQHRSVAIAAPVARWARLVADVLADVAPPEKVDHWARRVRLAPRTLRSRCAAAGVGAKASLDLIRVLHALTHAESNADPLGVLVSTLGFLDPRTVARLIHLANVPSWQEHGTVEMFLLHQRLVPHPQAILGLVALGLDSPCDSQRSSADGQ